MDFDPQFWVQILIYAVSFGVVYGQITTRIKYLEQKVDKHNEVVERMAMAERDIKSAHRRIDEMREELP
ncbi:hypothetical protein [Neobittarella massiliensis]|uniref:Uncharacterized protein n=2 Tax=Oscillospiraceae TaxID=216572 RepID=A0A8J6INM6_9FIRM|nr:hypothetical protein [Neobittarella massiliensis]MBC3515917.1 hypothetical protein [Neobittarella massiliensis]SCJ42653.1 Uncharacterised protein [uncultured Anaerotruncus sp.]